MSDLPEGLDPADHVELHRRSFEPWARRIFLAILLACVIAALAGAVGQRASSSTATGPVARLDVRAPKVVRGGLLFQARIRVEALQKIDMPRLVLSNGWLDGMQVNTVAPGPDAEFNRDGRLVWEYDQSLAAGRDLTVYIQFQVNPTSVGESTNDVAVYDGQKPLVKVTRTLRRLP